MSTEKTHEKVPLVYSCSGCSNAAQMTNYLALKMTRREIAEMSCIAGIGGDVKPLVRKAKEAKAAKETKETRDIIALDGCHLSCVKSCLAKHNITPDHHFILSEFGIKKKNNEDFDLAEADKIFAQILSEIDKK